MNSFRTPTLSLPITRQNSGDDRRIFTGSCLESPQFDVGYDDPPLGVEYCALQKPFVVLDVIWNLAFVLVSVFVLLTTIREKPSTPLRIWIGGYASLCLLHVGFVCFQYQRQRRTRAEFGAPSDGLSFSLSHNCIVKRLESMNTLVSSIWWVFGFYWIVVGGQALLQDSPRLYWLAVVFLAFDVFFMVLCIVMASVVFFTIFCCLPLVATIAYAMKIAEGASEKDIRSLPRYKFCLADSLKTFGKQEPVKLTNESGSGNSVPGLALPPEDSECCICLHKYAEGSELCRLPCKHHFHHKCICKWLRINATCPLCKFNIRDDALV